MAGWLALFSPLLPTPTGNINLGLNGFTYFGGSFPFINVLKSAGEINISNSAVPGVNYSSAVPQGAVDVFGNQSAFGSGKYLDNNGDLLSSLPAGTITYNRLLSSYTSPGPYNYLNPSPAAMTVDWQGGSSGWTVTVTGAGGPFATGTGTTPLTFNWPNVSQVNLIISGSGANPPTQIRIYKTALQSDLNAGKILEPGYRDQMIAGAKYFRAMDWLNTNWNVVTDSISDYPALACAGWAAGGRGYGTVNNNMNGVPLDAITKSASETNKIPWICIPEGFANKNIREIYSISRSSTPVVTTYGPHNFSNGDTVIFSNYSPYCSSLLTNPTSYATSTFTVSGTNVLANDTPIVFGIQADGSTDSSTYPTGITKGTIYWTVNATSTTYQIASTVGGSALVLSGSMTGTINVLENYNGGLTSGQFGQFRRVTSYSASTWTLNNHGLANGTPISFGIPATVPFNPGADGSTYPTGINISYTYYVVNATANTFQTALTVGGSAMSLSGSMTGPINIWLHLSFAKFTVANVTTSTFEITGPGANTAGYYGKSQRVSGVGAGVVFSPYSLTDMDTKVAALVNYIRTRLPANHVPIWEFSNEIWNGQFSAYHNNGSQVPDSYTPDGVIGNTPVNNYMNGYLQAAIAHSVRKAYGSHSGYKFIFAGSQEASDTLGDTYGAIAGTQKYLTDHGGGLTITDLFDHLSVTSYLGSVSYGPNSSPISVTFGTNTIAFGSNVGPNLAAFLNMPVKLNTNSPGGTLPTGLTAGTLGGSSYPSGSGTIYWTVGSSPNFGLATTPNGSPISFTGGSGSNTATVCPQDVIQSLMATSQSLHSGNPALYPSDWTYISDKIAEDIYDARWTGGLTQAGYSTAGNFTVLWQVSRYNYFINNYTGVGKPLAGLSLIAYEGGESNVPTGGFALINDATWQAMYTFQQYSAGSATNMMQLYTASVTGGLITNLAQFVDVAALSINYDFGDFGAKQYIGDTNARWLGVVAVNALN